MKLITLVLQGIVSLLVIALGVYFFFAFVIIGGIAGNQAVINEGTILAISMVLYGLITIVVVILGALKKRVPTTALIAVKSTLIIAIGAYLLSKADTNGIIWISVSLVLITLLEIVSIVEINKKELSN